MRTVMTVVKYLPDCHVQLIVDKQYGSTWIQDISNLLHQPNLVHDYCQQIYLELS